MTLRRRTLLTVGLSLAICLIVIIGVAATALRWGLEQAERARVQQIVTGIVSAHNLTVDEFNARFGDWSDWDDTCQFLRNRNREFVRSNLVL